MIVRDKMEFDDFYLAYLVDPVELGLVLSKKNQLKISETWYSTPMKIKKAEKLKISITKWTH